MQYPQLAKFTYILLPVLIMLILYTCAFERLPFEWLVLVDYLPVDITCKYITCVWHYQAYRNLAVGGNQLDLTTRMHARDVLLKSWILCNACLSCNI